MPMRYAKCVECGQQAKPATGAMIYPDKPQYHKRLFYLCQCGAYCGAHDSGRPLGSPAGPATRASRQKAHRVFDALWRERHMSRRRAYKWLADALGIDFLNCHIALMNREMAERVVRVARAKLEESRNEAREAAE